MSPVRDHVDAITRQAAVKAGLDPDSDARHELASHLYDLARDRAVGRPVTQADIDAAWAELEPNAIYLLSGEDGMTDEPPAATPARHPHLSVPKGAPWTLRFLAYLVDVALVVLAEIFAIMFMVEVIHPEEELAVFLGILLVLAAPVILVRLETHRGGTPGKLLFKLHTTNATGENPSWRQALLITLPKFFPPLLVLDVMLGMLFRWKQKVRSTESWAKVRVLRRL